MCESRRTFLQRLAALGIAVSASRPPWEAVGAKPSTLPEQALTFPGPWAFSLPRSWIILVSDQQLEDLQDPDREVDLSTSSTPHLTTLRKMCEQAKAQGARTLILAFDEFWTQYRKGQGGKSRQLLPDTEGYLQRLARISQTLKAYDLGLELSLLSPLEIGRGYQEKTGESGRWVHYREGYRDPATGQFTVSLWEQRRWTNNKGSIVLKRTGVRLFAFREQRLAETDLYWVDPAGIVELKATPDIEVGESPQPSTDARRLIIRGRGETQIGGLNRVLAVVSYATPEMDYFSPQARPFLEELVRQYRAAGVPLNGLYADEMHIQQDWGYNSHQDEGQLTFRYLTPHLANRYAELYGAEFKDFEKYMVYFTYAQHGFLPNLEARVPAQHVLGRSAEEIQKTFLLRRRYYELLKDTVVGLFAGAKQFAEKAYGHELEARAHATWAQSPTCDFWRTRTRHGPPRRYDYTPDFWWSNTVHQAASACDDYFAWNDFLTGGGNDHAEGGWSDRNYYGIALACSTGILNRTPYAYAAAWGMPHAAAHRRQAVCDAFGASASPWFQAVQDCQHRDTDVLMLYPLSLVACEERFGSWMVQYAYANYVTPQRLLQHGRVNAKGQIEMAGRKFGTVAVLFEPLPPPGLLDLLDQFASAGGKVIWAGPPPRVDLAGKAVQAQWQKLFGVKALRFDLEGHGAGGWQVQFAGRLAKVPPQTILTDFLVDYIYPVEPDAGPEVVARVGQDIVGVHRTMAKTGSATFVGFRPRDDQAASLGAEVRTWFEILLALGAYPGSGADENHNDNPSVVSRRTDFVACSFPNGTTVLAAHYRAHVESWPGGFHRDAKRDQEILAKNPLPSAALELQELRVNGHLVSYKGQLAVAFRMQQATLGAFAGYECQKIAIDGREFAFASAPMALVAWAPVLPQRRVPGGASMEIWVQGEADMSLPLPQQVTNGELYAQGAKLGSFGEKITCDCTGSTLRFKALNAWGQRRLFFVPA
ncbi:MAG TPA: hypothetical protein PLC99_21945 [Verrucomicrobiota bacterium]|nr:hypothetical protein [Verrucomicrobiota bacterium]